MLEVVSEAMAGIQTSSQKIRSIVDLMEDISFQTNLLALNAGVEPRGPARPVEALLSLRQKFANSRAEHRTVRRKSET